MVLLTIGDIMNDMIKELQDFGNSLWEHTDNQPCHNNDRLLFDQLSTLQQQEVTYQWRELIKTYTTISNSLFLGQLRLEMVYQIFIDTRQVYIDACLGKGSQNDDR